MTNDGRASVERAILLIVGASGMLVPLNSTMIAVAIPRITAELDATVTESGWLVTAYLITMAAFQPIAGKLGDRLGRRPFLLGGIVVFGVASVGAALATSVWVLIAFRAGQALAGAVVFPNGSALLREIVPEHRRGARFGLLGSAIAFGAAIGPPLGGVLVQAGGWPAIFWVNVPLTAVILLVGWRTIPARRYEPSSARFDLVGAGLLAAALAMGAWLLTRLGTVSPATAIVVGTLVLGVFALFLVREFSYADPVVQPRFFARPVFASATGGIALSNLSMYALLLAIPLLLERRAGWSEAQIGLVITAMSVGMVVFAPIGGRLSDRFGRRGPAVGGLSILSLGVTALAIAGPEVGGSALVGTLALAGVGLGLGSGSLQTSAVESIEARHAGMAAAASSTSRYIGSIVGAAVLAGFAASGRFQPVLTMTAVAAIAAAALALGLPASRPRERVHEGAAVPAT